MRPIKPRQTPKADNHHHRMGANHRPKHPDNAPRTQSQPIDPLPQDRWQYWNARAKYRLHRLWITPKVRLFTKIGLPIMAITLIGAIWIQYPNNKAILDGWVRGAQNWVYQHPNFVIRDVSITGASEKTDALIRQTLNLKFPQSFFKFDISQMHEKLTDLPPVETAALRVKSNNILHITVTERQSALVWRHKDKLSVIDAQGIELFTLNNRHTRPDLPLIAGQSANQATAQALDLLAILAPLGNAVVGLARVGERRWDVVLDSGIRILLPQTHPEKTLEHILQLHKTKNLLNRDIVVVDARNADRLTLRLGHDGLGVFKDIKAAEFSAGG